METKSETEVQTSEGSTASDGSREAVKLPGSRGAIFGVKAGMTQIYTEDGGALPVTVIDIRTNVVTQVKNSNKDGYSGVQIGLIEKGKNRATKPEAGHAKKAGAEGFYFYGEIRLTKPADNLAIGQVLSSEMFSVGDMVDLSARSKGKGFQGGMKRFHMSGNYKTHGASLSHRSLGSIGNRADPGKCFKNKKMPGQMGNERVTIQNVKVVKVDHANGLLLVHGSVPGPKSGVVLVRHAIKTSGKATKK